MIGLGPLRRRRTNAPDVGNQLESVGVVLNPKDSNIYEVNEEDTLDQLEIMSCRDRTSEFLSTIKSLQSRQGKILPGAGKENGYLRPRSQFTILAKKIGMDISNTFVKLEKLTLLAKRKSLFDDKAIEIQELTYIIKQDITHLNQQISQLHQIVNSNHTDKSKHVQTHSHSVVISLQSKLAHMSKDFKDVLEVRTENMKQQKQRRDQFSQGPMADSLPSAALSGHISGSALQRNSSNPNQQEASSSIAIEMPGFDNHGSQAQAFAAQEDYIKTRADAMENIEQTIVELGGIFSQLAHMVKEQEEEIKRIDSNVEETESNVELAHTEILKYFQSISSNRWLMIKIFFVLIVFFIIFVVFMT
ncbi:syntaxin-5-like [Rhopilema esculentum]|uniref:syntaxin-5-like n=1 Tax=Rhopilema esculentum TaxID=499914 RepID=UPI0031D8B1E6